MPIRQTTSRFIDQEDKIVIFVCSKKKGFSPANPWRAKKP